MQDVILMITSIFYPDFQKNASKSIGCLTGERSYESSPDTEVRKTNQCRIMRGPLAADCRFRAFDLSKSGGGQPAGIVDPNRQCSADSGLSHAAHAGQ